MRIIRIAKAIFKTQKAKYKAQKKQFKKRLGLAGGNTIKTRKRIKSAIKRGSFFGFLVAVQPLLPIALFLPLLAIQPALKPYGDGTMASITAVLKVVSLILSSLVLVIQILYYWARFCPILKRRKSN